MAPGPAPNSHGSTEGENPPPSDATLKSLFDFRASFKAQGGEESSSRAVEDLYNYISSTEHGRVMLMNSNPENKIVHNNSSNVTDSIVENLQTITAGFTQNSPATMNLAAYAFYATLNIQIEGPGKTGSGKSGGYYGAVGVFKGIKGTMYYDNADDLVGSMAVEINCYADSSENMAVNINWLAGATKIIGSFVGQGPGRMAGIGAGQFSWN